MRKHSYFISESGTIDFFAFYAWNESFNVIDAQAFSGDRPIAALNFLL